jgi:hypothetical protein
MKKAAAFVSTACLLTAGKFVANASTRALIGHSVVATILHLF